MSPSSRAIALAEQAKATIIADESAMEYTPASEWFVKRPGHRYNRITFEDMAHHADQAYHEFRTVDPAFETEHSLNEQLAKWLQETSVYDIAVLIDKTPSGLAACPHTGIAFRFTPWQRISLAFKVFPFFDMTSSIRLDTDKLRTMARYGPEERTARKTPLQADSTIFKGHMSDVTICDIQTAGGKTAWILAKAGMSLSSEYFPKFMEEERAKLAGVIFQGRGGLNVARLALVGVAGSTFDHFVQTAERLIPKLKTKDPQMNYCIWSKMSQSYSIKVAFEKVNTTTFWFVPVKEINKVLREYPEISVAVGIIDEFTVDTPKEKSLTKKSKVLKWDIAQATPQMLVQATRGNRSWLKDMLGGPLVAPSSLEYLVRLRCWSEAQRACDQYCMLNLMTLTPFRPLIRQDLKSLMPAGLIVYFASSKRVSLASLLANSHTDLVPANLANVIIRSLQGFRPKPESIEAFRAAVTNEIITPDALKQHIINIESIEVNPMQHQVNAKQRLIDRMDEFSNQCPICFNEPSDSVSLHVFGCCGYTVCGTCAASCIDNKCAFCRTCIPLNFRRTEVMLDANVAETGEHIWDAKYPVRPSFVAPDGFTRLNLEDLIELHCHHHNQMIFNLTMAMHCLLQKQYTRTLVLIEKSNYALGSFDNIINLYALQSRTGFRCLRIDQHLSGKATQFVKIKKEFDTPNPEPMALFSFGIDDRLLIGTDFAWADSVLTLGHIEQRILDQAIARTNRPRASRDNSKDIAMICIDVKRRAYA